MRDRSEERRRDDDTDQAIEHIARREPAACGIAGSAAFNQRINGAAEIGPKHQRQRCRLGDEMRVGERHRQQDDGDTRMRRPGQCCRDQNAKHRVIGDGGR